MKFRDIREAPKTAVLAFGRMNPPTIGHKKLADKVASLPGDPYIFVSQSQKPKTDPLSFQDKLKYAKASFPGVTVGSSDVKTIIQALQKIEAMGYDSIIYVAGSDRIQDFTRLINQYNGKDYNFNKIDVVSAGERDPDAEGAEGMSASKMRAAAAAGDFDSFKQGVANPKIAQKMFTDVRKGMGVEEGAMKRMAQAQSNKADRIASTNKLTPGLDTYKKKPKKTNEAYKLQLERGKEMDVLHIVDTKTGGRTEVRGKPGYESGNYDSNDRLHKLLDKVGRSANISELINGEVVSINPKHPDAAKAKSATDVAYNESSELDSLRKFVRSQREAPDQVLYQMMMAPDTYGHAASNFVRSWYEKTKEENGLNDVDSALEIMVDQLGMNENSIDDKTKGAIDKYQQTNTVGKTSRAFTDIEDEYLNIRELATNLMKNGLDAYTAYYKASEKMQFDPAMVFDWMGSEFKDEELEDFIPIEYERDWIKRAELGMSENFADGKVKGKSRPGRVKRAGASCNGSVTALRKRAKNSSGEKARMYHWCANMKSGRKKK